MRCLGWLMGASKGRKREASGDSDADESRENRRETMRMENSPDLTPWQAVKAVARRIRHKDD